MAASVSSAASLRSEQKHPGDMRSNSYRYGSCSRAWVLVTPRFLNVMVPCKHSWKIVTKSLISSSFGDGWHLLQTVPVNFTSWGHALSALWSQMWHALFGEVLLPVQMLYATKQSQIAEEESKDELSIKSSKARAPSFAAIVQKIFNSPQYWYRYFFQSCTINHPNS